jgi:ABC-type transport system substrate-binding protein
MTRSFRDCRHLIRTPENPPAPAGLQPADDTAYTATSAVAREVVEKYRDGQGQVMANPVGSGPYRLTEWVRGSRMVLEANPGYREHYWDSDPGADPEKQKLRAR